MGLFDTIYSDYPLPVPPRADGKERAYQTKSLDNCLMDYRILANGRLIQLGMNQETGFHGILNIYDNDCDADGNTTRWYEMNLYFVYGELDGIEITTREHLSGAVNGCIGEAGVVVKVERERECRPFTEAEVREKFLAHVREMVRYWEDEERQPGIRQKLEGLAFSLLALIDGEAASLPGFALIPCPHPDDKAFHEARGEDYYPDFSPGEDVCDISGSLHSEFVNPPKGRKAGR